MFTNTSTGISELELDERDHYAGVYCKLGWRTSSCCRREVEVDIREVPVLLLSALIQNSPLLDTWQRGPQALIFHRCKRYETINVHEVLNVVCVAIMMHVYEGHVSGPLRFHAQSKRGGYA